MQLIAEGLAFPEGPVAMADGSVVLVETAGRTLSRIAPDGVRTVIAELDGGPNGAAVGPDGALYVTNNGGSFSYTEMGGMMIPGPTPPGHQGGSIQRVDLATGAVRTLYTHAGERRLNGPNDLVFDAEGGFWFTDHGCTTPDGRLNGGLFYARPDGGRIVCVRDGLYSPNGVGLSPDGTVVYAADTYMGRLWAFDLAAPGVLAEAPMFQPGRVITNMPGYQLFDSLAVEAGGAVCVATIINGGVSVITPEGAVEHVPVPDILTTNLCFGGADMQDAWITASGTGRLYKTRWPRPGLKLAFNA